MRAALLIVALAGLLQSQTGARDLFHQWSRDYVGIHYWFQNAAGQRLTEADAARTDAPVTLHIRGNVAAFLTVWDARDQETVQLTPLDPDPRVSGQGRWSGVRLDAGEEYVVPGAFGFGPASPSRRLIIIFCRSQTEQAHNARQAPETLQRHLARKRPDGSSAIVSEVEPDGTYVVNRLGGVAVAAIVFGSRR